MKCNFQIFPLWTIAFCDLRRWLGFSCMLRQRDKATPLFASREVWTSFLICLNQGSLTFCCVCCGLLWHAGKAYECLFSEGFNHFDFDMPWCHFFMLLVEYIRVFRSVGSYLFRKIWGFISSSIFFQFPSLPLGSPITCVLSNLKFDRAPLWCSVHVYFFLFS